MATAHAGPSLLFVRGADRSGGFLEAQNDFGRTEQLADIDNASTSGGNHGWKQLADHLRGNGFTVEQITEAVEPGNFSGQSQGVAVPFEVMDLSTYDALVFGSNNASYNTPQVDAIENYIRGGGGAVFISDANFGSDWADASNSDQHFLNRFGLTANQDQGTYSLTRGNGEYLVPSHPILDNVNTFDGEGVTPITVASTLPAGVDVTILARAEGQVRRNQPPFGGNNQGASAAAGSQDAALLAATADAGRIVGHFDRNTFFNTNGAGTSITRFDNQQLALNLFQWVTGSEPINGDLDSDGFVGIDDLNLVLANWNLSVPPGDPLADPTGNGFVGIADLGYVLGNWNAGTPPITRAGSVVPEPGVAPAVLLGLVSLAGRRCYSA